MGRIFQDFLVMAVVSHLVQVSAENLTMTAELKPGPLPLPCDENLEEEYLTCGVCVPKCCGPKEIWDVRKESCHTVQNGIYWTPRFYEAVTDRCLVPMDTSTIPPNFNTSLCGNITQRLSIFRKTYHDIKFRNCSAVFLPFRRIGHIAGQRFRLLVNGSVFFRDKYGSWHEIRPGNFCIDAMQKSGKTEYKGHEADTMLWVCQGEYNFKRVKRPIPIYYALMLFSASFLLFITAFVYGLLWRQNGVYEWLIFSDVISNLFMVIFVATGHSIGRNPEDSDLGSVHCIVIGATAHFFFLASFSWTFIICFELWWIFRKLEPVNRRLDSLRRLAFYQVAGWGAPGVTISVGLILDKYYGLHNMEVDCSPITTPNYGLLNCYLSKPAQGPYLFYPIGIILICNLIFFTLTILQMRRHQESTKSALEGPESASNNKNQAQLTTVFAKLFAIMGLSWIFALVAWMISSSKFRSNAITNDEDAGVPLYWIIYDIVISLQAVAIFFIFTCKSEIFLSVWKRYPALRVILKPFTYIPGCQVQRDSKVNLGMSSMS